MNKKNSITDLVNETQPVEPTENPEPDAKAIKKAARREAIERRKQRKLRKVRTKPKPNKKRVFVFLDEHVHTKSKQRVQDGYSPHQHLSPTLNLLMDNWNKGLYDDVHDELGWFDPDED